MCIFKGILPAADCLKKSYLPGGWSAPYFSVGFEFKSKKGRRYSAQYIYIPAKENANKLTWNDASDTQIYAINVSGMGGSSHLTVSPQKIQENFKKSIKYYSKPSLQFIRCWASLFLRIYLRKISFMSSQKKT